MQGEPWSHWEVHQIMVLPGMVWPTLDLRPLHARQAEEALRVLEGMGVANVGIFVTDACGASGL